MSTDVEKIKKDLDKLSPAEKEKLGNTAAKVTLQQLQTMDLKDAILTLTDSALSTDDAFFRIQKTLEDVKTHGDEATPDLKKDAEGLLHTWTGHRKTFVKLLWRSREVAGEAESTAKDYAGSIMKFLQMPEEKVTPTVKANYIDKYVTRLTGQESRARDLTDGFSELFKNVGYFKTNWEDVVEKHKAKVKKENAERIAALTKRIEDLNEDLKRKNNEIAELNAKLTQFAKDQKAEEDARKGVSGFFTRVIPGFFAGVVGKIFGGGNAENPKIPSIDPLVEEQRKIEGELAQANADILTPHQNQDAVNKLEEGLKGSTADFASLSDKLSAFATVWARIKHDIGQIKNSLQTAGEGDEDEPFVLWGIRMEKVTADYLALQQALELYATVVIKLPPLPAS